MPANTRWQDLGVLVLTVLSIGIAGAISLFGEIVHGTPTEPPAWLTGIIGGAATYYLAQRMIVSVSGVISNGVSSTIAHAQQSVRGPSRSTDPQPPAPPAPTGDIPS